MSGLVSVFLILLSVGVTGCSRERARALETRPQAAAPDQKDYRGMLQRARDRTTAEGNVAALESARNQFLHDAGRLPSNLLELVTQKYLPEIPAAPEGHEYVYDATTGNIELFGSGAPVSPGEPPLHAAP